jgi:hypothetical protein
MATPEESSFMNSCQFNFLAFARMAAEQVRQKDARASKNGQPSRQEGGRK